MISVVSNKSTKTQLLTFSGKEQLFTKSEGSFAWKFRELLIENLISLVPVSGIPYPNLASGISKL